MKNLSILIGLFCISIHFQIAPSDKSFKSPHDQILKNRLSKHNKFGVIEDKKYKKEPATEVQFTIGGIKALNKLPVEDRHGKIIMQHLDAILQEFIRPEDSISRYNHSQALQRTHNYIERPLLVATINLIHNYESKSCGNQIDEYIQNLHKEYMNENPDSFIDSITSSVALTQPNFNQVKAKSYKQPKLTSKLDPIKEAAKENIKRDNNTDNQQQRATVTQPKSSKRKAKKYKQQQFTQALRCIEKISNVTKK
jgi:hypothetical protein